jgi:hypothetical protein
VRITAYWFSTSVKTHDTSGDQRFVAGGGDASPSRQPSAYDEFWHRRPTDACRAALRGDAVTEPNGADWRLT